MSETKVVRNSSGKDITVEYGGRHYRFDAGSEKAYPTDLADVAQYRHAHEGLNIVFAAETVSPVPEPPKRTVTVTVLHQEVAPEPQTFRCPEGDFATNDKDAYDAHLVSAHGLSRETPEETPPAESPSAAPPAPAPPASAPRSKAPAKAKEKKTR